MQCRKHRYCVDGSQIFAMNFEQFPAKSVRQSIRRRSQLLTDPIAPAKSSGSSIVVQCWGRSARCRSILRCISSSSRRSAVARRSRVAHARRVGARNGSYRCEHRRGQESGPEPNPEPNPEPTPGCIRRSPAFARQTLKDRAGSDREAATTRSSVGNRESESWTCSSTLPAKLNKPRLTSGRSPDLRFIEIGQPSQGQTPQWLHTECQSLGVYSYGVVTELHRLPEHQML